MIEIRAYTVDDFIERYLPAQQPRYGIKATVLHHTYRPRAKDYTGPISIDAIRRYHIHNCGWRDIGANAYAAPDGRVYNARPLSWNNYAHAHISKAWSHVPADVRELAYPDRNWLNHHGFGIETIGDFDEQAIDPIPPALEASLRVLAAVHTRYKLAPERLFLHRDVAYKSCPGNRISREWARREVSKRMEHPDPTLRIVLLPGSQPVACNAAVENGVTRCDLRPLAEALGCEVIADDIAAGTVYVRRADAPRS